MSVQTRWAFPCVAAPAPGPQGIMDAHGLCLQAIMKVLGPDFDLCGGPSVFPVGVAPDGTPIFAVSMVARTEAPKIDFPTPSERDLILRGPNGGG